MMEAFSVCYFVIIKDDLSLADGVGGALKSTRSIRCGTEFKQRIRRDTKSLSSETCRVWINVRVARFHFKTSCNALVK